MTHSKSSVLALLVYCVIPGTLHSEQPIDRHALVTRHNVLLTAPDPLSSLSVGNGEFAFTVDITGLQTFPEHYAGGVQLGTQSQWGWDAAVNLEKFTIDDVLSPYDAHGRQVLYADGRGLLKNRDNPDRARKANAWLRENPHRVQLGRLGLVLLKADHGPAQLKDLRNFHQVLDLWTGRISSQFEFDGQTVRIETIADPMRDAIAVRIESPLVKAGRLGAVLAFSEPGTTKAIAQSERRTDFERSLQTSKYYAALAWSAGAALDHRADGARILAPGGGAIEVTLAFSPQKLAQSNLASFAAVGQAAADWWSKFWLSGGALDLSQSKDPRWKELERRCVLSQYLTAIQCSGSMPPQETGLVQNSWSGKFHLEMHWWHAAHFVLWGRPELLEHSLGWYKRILPAARTLAQRNGYAGVRWPKMVGPDGEDSPSSIGGFLIWQQPHPIYFAELLYRDRPTRVTLEKYRDIVASTAEFMASYAVWDTAAKAYVLGPPLIPAQESYGRMRETVTNPTFELAYWHWGLQTAQKWRERLGLPRNPHWDEVCRGLAKPAIRQAHYEAIAVEPFTLTVDHPSLLQAYGFLPATPRIEPAVMDRTLDYVLQRWNWNTTWGWDYPVVAMTAARLGRGDDAVSALMMNTPKNRFLPNGHNYQRGNLPLYLPGNGGLLAALAMMAAGWDGCPQKAAPGFPADGQWTMRWEKLQRMP